LCLRGIRPDCRSRRQRRSNKLSEPDPSHRRRRVHRIELHPLPTSLLARRGDHQSGSAQLLREPREPQGPARCFSPHLRQRGCRRLGPGRGSAAAAPHPRRHRIETVVHFAGETHVDRSIAGPEAFIEANVVGTFRLLEACRKTWLPPAPERVTPATAAPAGSRRLGSSWRRPGSTTSTCAGPFCSGRADGAPSRAGRRRGDDRTAQHWSRPIAGRPPRGRRAFSLRRLRFPARGGHVAAGVGSFPASADVRVDQTRRATRARAGHLISACSVEAPSGETVSASASAGSLWNGPSPEAGLRRRGLGHARCGLLAPCGRNHTSTPGSPASRPDSGH